MKEEFVTLETAKLLKEKGFDEYCKDIINYKGIIMETIFRRIWVCAIPSCNVFLMNAGRDVLAGIARIRNKSRIIHEYQGKI